MMKKIYELTKIFLIDYYQKLNIIKNNKINYSSIFTWAIIIISAAEIYCSSKVLNYLIQIGDKKLFLKIYLPIIAVVMIFQIIIMICNIFYYSKDLEHIISLPLKIKEILLSKFNTLLGIMYMMEGIFLLIPLIMYGVIVEKNILYFINMFFSLLIFPIFYILIINIFMFFVMKISKIIKNKEVFQIIVIGTIIFLLFFLGVIYLKNIIEERIELNISPLEVINIKIDKINDKLIIINPIINFLTSNNSIEKIYYIFKLILINVILVNIYIYIGNKMYLKNILININNMNNKIKFNNKYKYKEKSVLKSYIKNDVKKIIRDPIFVIQNVIQYIYICIIFVIILYISLNPTMEQIKQENFIEKIGNNNFYFQCILIILGYFQIIFTFCNLSITAISREGKDVIFMKYIPINLYKQIQMKILPQLFMNSIIIFFILFILYLKVPNISIKYYISIFILGMLLNVIYGYITILIDLKNANINWMNKENVNKNVKNKLVKVLILIIILLSLNYFSKIFKDLNINLSIILLMIIFTIIIIIIKLYMKKNIYKLFEKIY